MNIHPSIITGYTSFTDTEIRRVQARIRGNYLVLGVLMVVFGLFVSEYMSATEYMDMVFVGTIIAGCIGILTVRAYLKNKTDLKKREMILIETYVEAKRTKKNQYFLKLHGMKKEERVTMKDYAAVSPGVPCRLRLSAHTHTTYSFEYTV